MSASLVYLLLRQVLYMLTLRVPKTSSVLAMAALIIGMRSAAVPSSRARRGRNPCRYLREDHPLGCLDWPTSA
jgi:hypothetical protein